MPIDKILMEQYIEIYENNESYHTVYVTVETRFLP